MWIQQKVWESHNWYIRLLVLYLCLLLLFLLLLFLLLLLLGYLMNLKTFPSSKEPQKLRLVVFVGLQQAQVVFDDQFERIANDNQNICLNRIWLTKSDSSKLILITKDPLFLLFPFKEVEIVVFWGVWYERLIR